MITKVRVAADAMKDAGFPELSDGLLVLAEGMEGVTETLEGVSNEAGQTRAMIIELMERVHTLESIAMLACPEETHVQVPLNLVKWACGLLMIADDSGLKHGLSEQDCKNLRRLRKCATDG